jgi:peptidoglycan/LPS O-acetylase OafA/YrhL
MGKSPEMKMRATDASIHLDAIRGIAAVWVLLGHSRQVFISSTVTALLVAQNQDPDTTVLPNNESVFTRHLRIGNLMGGHTILTRLAVIVFFVLSGYLVGGSVLRTVRRGSFSWKKYMFQRLTRLWVVLIPALLLGAVLDASGQYLLQSHLNIYRLNPQVSAAIGSQFTPSAFFGSVFFLQGIVSHNFGTNGPLWSLSCEFWYYVCFPLLVIVLMGSMRTRIQVADGLLLVFLLAMCGWTIGPYFLIWLLGAGVALLPLRLPDSLRKISTAAAALAVFFTGFLVLKFPTGGQFSSEFVFGVAFSILLWTLLHAQEYNAPPFYRTAAHTLSGMSYTLYLVHYPMLCFISALIFPVWRRWPMSLVSMFHLFLIVIVVFAAAWLTYFCFERNTPRIRVWLTQLGRNRA